MGIGSTIGLTRFSEKANCLLVRASPGACPYLATGVRKHS